MENININEMSTVDMLPAVESSADKIEIEQVDYKALTKEQLIDVLKSKDTVIDNYKTINENLTEEHQKELENLNDYYKRKITELSNIIKYYERKFKVLKDILDIETGGDK